MVSLLNISTGFFSALPSLCIVIIIHFQGFITIYKQMMSTLSLTRTSLWTPVINVQLTNLIPSSQNQYVQNWTSHSPPKRFPPDLHELWGYYHLPSCPNQKFEIYSWFICLSSHSHTTQLQIQLLLSPKYIRKRKSISPYRLCHKPSPGPLSFLIEFSTIASHFLVCPLFTTAYKASGDILIISISSHYLPT